jgi:hypothetical protein
MKNKTILIMNLLVVFVLSACGGKVAATPETAVFTSTPEVAAAEFTSTPDPCSAENLPVEVARVNKLMREFDDYSLLASNTPQAQLIQVIPELQRILRDAEDQTVPGCLYDLKKLQLVHMSIVVNTLMSFMNTKNAAGAEKINAGIAEARKVHGQYDIEMAALLGLTLAVSPTSPPAAATPEASAFPISAPAITVTNAGTAAVNLRSEPDMNAPQAGLLGAQISAIALGKTADDQWIQVLMPDKPDQTAWVYAQLIQLSAPILSLPVVAP